MKFDVALLRINGEEDFIDREDISRRSDFLEVIENLYCPEKGCNAKLVYNRRSTGVVYLSKHKSYEHSTDCPRFEDSISSVNTIMDYVEINGGLTSKGIKRRKKEASQELLEYFNPSEKVKKKGKGSKSSVKNQTDEGTSTKVGIKVNYEPNSEVVTISDENDRISVKEPPFYKRLPHEISIKDNGKNIRTSALIENITIDKDLSTPSAKIEASFEKKKLTFILPPVFFQGNQRSLSLDQLFSYLDTIRDYFKKNPNQYYLTTLCQSQEIDLSNVVLYILEPDFMSFQTLSGKFFDSLTSIVVAITTKAI